MYQYQTQKAYVFTEGGQRDFLKVRDHVHETLKKAGAIRMQEAMAPITGSSWDQMACVDRLLELNEIREIKYGECAGQHRIFVSARH